MRFNDKELGAWASVFSPDKEGLLEKKGAGRGQGYKQRWFRLKGNLLFYFKVDELGGWESCGEPVGVIVLERCRAERIHHDTRPYSFVLAFENDDSRTYVLSAFSQPELDSWILAIRMSSYEGLKAMYYELTNKINTLTGKSEQLKLEKGLGISSALSSPSRIKKNMRRSAYLKAPNGERARRLNTMADSQPGPQVELSLRCEQLPVKEEGCPPSTLVRVRCYGEGGTSALSTFSLTELIKCSCSPVYSHLVLLEIGPSCPKSGQLVFEVFHIESSSTESEGEEEDLWDSTDPNYVTKYGEVVGRAECLVSAVLSGGDTPLKLHLCKEANGLVCGFVYVKPLMLQSSMNQATRRNALNPLDRGNAAGVLPNIMRASVRRHFLFSTSRDTKFKVIEEMSESVFNLQVPIELLKCYMKEDMLLVDELRSNVGALSERWQESMQEYQTMLFEALGVYRHAAAHLELMADRGQCTFKSSQQKKAVELMFVPTNLHIQRMRVRDGTGIGEPEKIYNVVTLGCPAHHCGGFKNGGLKKLLWESRSNPSFISRWSEGNATEVKNAMTQISDIHSSILHYINAVYMACANASPQNMNDAMIGVANQVQQLLQTMQLPVVMDAIEALIQARPYSATPTSTSATPTSSSATPTSGSPHESSPNLLVASEGGGTRGDEEAEMKKTPSLNRAARSAKWNSRQLSLRRNGSAKVEAEDETSPPPPPSPLQTPHKPDTSSGAECSKRTKCSCGRCSRCVPSPSDWIWNGTNFVQVSTREWKMSDSQDSIQHFLVRLINAVEEATTRIIQEQHEAAASSVGYTPFTYRPTYVWSDKLIPLFSELRQTLDGLVKLSMSSLAFKLMQLDLYVENLSVLRRRRDDVFSQVLTALITSFYLKLSEHFTHPQFLEQIREIGFLAQFESLLSTFGDESGMLEDTCVAVAELGTVTFQLGALSRNPDLRFDFHISGTRFSFSSS
jgi:hypothetical protein